MSSFHIALSTTPVGNAKSTPILQRTPSSSTLGSEEGQSYIFSTENTSSLRRNVEPRSNMSTEEALVQDVSGLKRNVNELFDLVFINYKELTERIKAIHGILDENEKRDQEEVNIHQIRKALNGQAPVPSNEVTEKMAQNSKEIEDLKNRLAYLEKQCLR